MGVVLTELATCNDKSTEVDVLLSKMTHPSWKDRIDAEGALAEFEKIFPKNP